MKKIKILFAIPELNAGGAERVILNIINSIDREAFEIHLALFNSSGVLVKELRDDVVLHDLHLSSVTKGIFSFIKKIYEIRPDVLFSGIGHLNIALAPFIPILRYLLPSTYWVARQSSIISINNLLEKRPSVHEWLYHHVYKNYDKIICQSVYMQNDLIDNYQFPIEQTEVINNPVDIKRINRLSSKASVNLLDKDSINLLSVGQLRPEKQQEFMIRALAMLDQRYRLTLIGDGVKRSSLEDLAEELEIQDRVRFLGYQSNPYIYMREADLLILSSKYEGFPNVVLEANVCGLPVVSLCSPGGVIEIIEEGVNGFLVSTKNIEDLVKGVERAVKYKFDTKVIETMMTERYSLDLIIKKYQKILKIRNKL